MSFNPIAIIISVLIPFFVGFIYYNPKVMGNMWMKEAGLSQDDMKKNKMWIIFSLVAFFNFLLSIQMHMITIHPFGLFSALQMHEAEMNTPGTVPFQIMELFKPYALDFRTFKHGALHGFLTSIFFALPIVGTNALFEQRSAKYILIHLAYWAINLTLVGAVVCGIH